MEEKWVDIKGYEGYYQVSNFGRVKSLARKENRKWGNKVIEKILKGSVNPIGYLGFCLRKENTEKTIRIHVLLAKHFIPNPNNYPVVRHLNDIKSDNRLENLAWGTHADNSKDAIKNGLTQKGEKSHFFGKRGAETAAHYRIGEKHPLFGKKGKDSHSSKMVLDTQTGIFYDSVWEAAQSTNFSKSHLAAMIRGDYENKTNFIYV